MEIGEQVVGDRHYRFKTLTMYLDMEKIKEKMN